MELRSSKPICVPGSPCAPKNGVGLDSKECKLQIDASAACEYICGNLTWHVRLKIYKTLIRPIFLYGSETWVQTKEKRTNYLYLRGRFSARYIAQKIRRCVLDREFNSPNIIGVVKSNSLRYKDRRCRRLSQRALYRAVPEGRRTQLKIFM
jgi:hypothetical protein